MPSARQPHDHKTYTTTTYPGMGRFQCDYHERYVCTYNLHQRWLPKVGCIKRNHHDGYVRSTVTARSGMCPTSLIWLTCSLTQHRLTATSQSGTCQVMRYTRRLHAHVICTTTERSCRLHGYYTLTRHTCRCSSYLHDTYG